VPDWDNQKALTIFEQMLQASDNKIDGVLAANDGLGNAAISALKQRKLPQIPVTGQDATLQGIQNIVNGDQCMTVYKAIKKEADAAAELAIALAKGEEPTVETTPINNGKHDVPSVLLEPVPVTKDNITEYLGEADFPTAEDICAGELADKCKELGIS
jgi:D-xylose transport system substrate-binding protein